MAWMAGAPIAGMAATPTARAGTRRSHEPPPVCNATVHLDEAQLDAVLDALADAEEYRWACAQASCRDCNRLDPARCADHARDEEMSARYAAAAGQLRMAGWAMSAGVACLRHLDAPGYGRARHCTGKPGSPGFLKGRWAADGGEPESAWSAVLLAGFQAFPDRQGGDDQGGHRVGLPRSEPGVEADAEQGGGGDQAQNAVSAESATSVRLPSARPVRRLATARAASRSGRRR